MSDGSEKNLWFQMCPCKSSFIGVLFGEKDVVPYTQCSWQIPQASTGSSSLEFPVADSQSIVIGWADGFTSNVLKVKNKFSIHIEISVGVNLLQTYLVDLKYMLTV